MRCELSSAQAVLQKQLNNTKHDKESEKLIKSVKKCISSLNCTIFSIEFPPKNLMRLFKSIHV